MSQPNLDNKEKIYQLALSLIKGIGFSSWKKLIEQFGSAQQLFYSSEHEIKNIVRNLSQPLIQAILQKNTINIAENIIEVHAQRNIQVISFFESSYPERLKHISNPPSFLYYQGNTQFDIPKVISIVGTRNATTYGKNAVEDLIAGLSEYKALIVSGLAYGIDIHAHKMALKHNLPTLAVLASGLDKIYPLLHTNVALEILINGGLVSESPIGSQLENFLFPNRNRIIAGLADATIVIEADNKSGAIITAKFSNAYNREVFAVPGSIYEPFSRGCNYLIKTQQANLLTSIDDIAYIMNWPDMSKNRSSASIIDINIFSELSPEEQVVVQAIQIFQREMHIDELIEQIQLSPDRISSILLHLELKNVIQCLPGNKFKLVSF